METMMKSSDDWQDPSSRRGATGLSHSRPEGGGAGPMRALTPTVAPAGPLRSAVRVASNLVVIALCLVLVAGAALLGLSRSPRQAHFGFYLFHVLTASMTPGPGRPPGGFSAGDLILVRQVDPASLQVGDVVSFKTDKDGNQHLTHRVVRVMVDEEGREGRWFVTRGDANDSDDPPIRADIVVGKKIFSIPMLGTFIQRTQQNLPAVIVFVISAIGFFIVLTRYVKSPAVKTPKAGRGGTPRRGQPPSRGGPRSGRTPGASAGRDKQTGRAASARDSSGRGRGARAMRRGALAGAAALSLTLLATGAFHVYSDHRERAAMDAQQRLKPPLPTSDVTTAEAEAGEEPPVMDFAGLRAQNGEIVAWLTVDGAGIDYPVAQASDNEYYLTHTAERRPSQRGAIFLDFRNTPDLSDFNNILYGHDMRDGGMFGRLSQFKDAGYFDQRRTGTLHTPSQTFRLEVFAVVVVPATSDYFRYAFASPSERAAYVDSIRADATLWRDLALDPERDRLVMLSTCSYEFEGARTAVFARLAAMP
jgi:sortase B